MPAHLAILEINGHRCVRQRRLISIERKQGPACAVEVGGRDLRQVAALSGRLDQLALLQGTTVRAWCVPQQAGSPGPWVMMSSVT